jgi:hypothetical protein
MNKEEAIREVSFIKKLLDDTSKQIVKSGAAFIWVGLVMYATAVLFQTYSGKWIFKWGAGSALNRYPADAMAAQIDSQSSLILGLAVVGLMIADVAAGLIIYRRTVARWSSATLEKQIWQIWTWALLITLLILGVVIKRTAHSLTVGLSSVSPANMNIAILVALAATGVLTNKTFFYQLIAFCILLNWGVKFLPPTWQNFSPLHGLINLLLPLWGTGLYFLWLKRKSAAKEGPSHGLEQLT